MELVLSKFLKSDDKYPFGGILKCSSSYHLQFITECPKTHTLMHCDSGTNSWIRKVINYRLDKENLICQKYVTHRSEPTCCPTKIIRIGNCSLNRAYWKEILLERRWDDHEQKCVIKQSVKTKRFCQCPPKKVNTECDNGVVIRTEVSFKLNKIKSVCQQIVRQSRYKPVCKETDGLEKSKQYQTLFYRHLQTKCDRSTCTRGLETYANEYNPSTCKCGWKLVSKKRCTCCGCPKPSLSYTCENDRLLIVDITYYTTKQHRCGHECMRRVRTVRHQMSCSNYPQAPQSYWGHCDRTTCQQSFISSMYEVKNCRCILTQKVIHTRTCCCSKLVKIKPGECRPQTCRRPIFLIKSIVDPNDCKCKQYQIVKEERECCCLSRSHQRLLCVGNCKIVIQQIYKFDNVSERCVKENLVRRKCPSMLFHLNNGFSVAVFSSFIEFLVKIRLENGRCVKQVKIEEKQVICPQKIEQNLSTANQYCDPNSCLKMVRSYTWNKIGCKCVRELVTAPQLCCCTNRIAGSKKHCSPSGTITLINVSVGI
ncbi:unnamed protein product [Trichobilharzia regenti]|nr:unnamed protein product [Trichobilharzia regenti]